MSETPESQAIHQAVKRYTDIHGPEGALLGKLVESIAAVLAIRWKQIREATEDPENDGMFSLTIKAVINRRGNTPIGNVKLTYTPKKVGEEVDFEVDDPNQGTLALAVTPRVAAAYPSPDDADQRD